MPIQKLTHPTIFGFFKKLKNSNEDYIDKLIVSSFVRVNNLCIERNVFLKSKLLNQEDRCLEKLVNIINLEQSVWSIENIIELFEYVVSPTDKEVNGAVYTPAIIREYIINEVFSRKKFDEHVVYADLSCGCGGFLYSLLFFINIQNPNYSIVDIIENNLLGVDIKTYSIERTRIVLSLFAICKGEDVDAIRFNLECQNTLSCDFAKNEIVAQRGGIDVVVGNPPYVGSAKIEEDNREYLKTMVTTKTGKSDLYIPFFEVALQHLNENGVLGYITVNNFYRSLNGRAFREYMSSKAWQMSIVDFGNEQVFPGCSTYTCICIIDKKPICRILYTESILSQLPALTINDFSSYSYNELDNQKGWLLADRESVSKIKRIENTGTPLGRLVDIKNGIATLKNDVYIFKPIKVSKEYYYLKDCEGGVFEIEKSICKDVIKPNVLKFESEIPSLQECIIFPYKMIGRKLNIIEETELKNDYPKAYHYLCTKKEVLSKRDKGKKQYPTWYAYGRSQALTIRGNKLLFPYITNAPYFVYSSNENLLFYNGYSIVSPSKMELQVLKKVLSSDIFWYYIQKTSKPYNSSYYALAKNYLKYFGVPAFSQEQKKELLEMTDKQKINDWLQKFYE